MHTNDHIHYLCFISREIAKDMFIGLQMSYCASKQNSNDFRKYDV